MTALRQALPLRSTLAFNDETWCGAPRATRLAGSGTVPNKLIVGVRIKKCVLWSSSVLNKSVLVVRRPLSAMLVSDRLGFHRLFVCVKVFKCYQIFFSSSFFGVYCLTHECLCMAVYLTSSSGRHSSD